MSRSVKHGTGGTDGVTPGTGRDVETESGAPSPESGSMGGTVDSKDGDVGAGTVEGRTLLLR